MTTIYVAGASFEAGMVARYIERLEEACIAVTYDWTHDVLNATKPDWEMTEKEKARHAFVDLDAVHRAQFFWLLAPPKTNLSTGAWVELGAALTERKIVVVSGPYQRCIFAELTNYRFPTHEGAFEWLTR